MSLLWEIRRRARHAAGPFIGACLVGYFAYHAAEGDRGLVALLHLKKQIEQAQTTLAETHKVRTTLERQVALLRDDHLDPDMLAERARIMLGYAYPDEVVVLDKGY